MVLRWNVLVLAFALVQGEGISSMITMDSDPYRVDRFMRDKPYRMTGVVRDRCISDPISIYGSDGIVLVHRGEARFFVPPNGLDTWHWNCGGEPLRQRIPDARMLRVERVGPWEINWYSVEPEVDYDIGCL